MMARQDGLLSGDSSVEHNDKAPITGPFSYLDN